MEKTIAVNNIKKVLELRGESIADLADGIGIDKADLEKMLIKDSSLKAEAFLHICFYLELLPEKVISIN